MKLAKTTIAAKLPVNKKVTLTNLHAGFIYNPATGKGFFRIEGMENNTPYAFTVNIPLAEAEPLFPMTPILSQLGLYKSYEDTDDICNDINSTITPLQVMLAPQESVNKVTGEKQMFFNVIADLDAIARIEESLNTAPKCAAPKKATK